MLVRGNNCSICQNQVDYIRIRAELLVVNRSVCTVTSRILWLRRRCVCVCACVCVCVTRHGQLLGRPVVVFAPFSTDNKQLKIVVNIESLGTATEICVQVTIRETSHDSVAGDFTSYSRSNVFVSRSRGWITSISLIMIFPSSSRPMQYVEVSRHVFLTQLLQSNNYLTAFRPVTEAMIATTALGVS